MKQVKIKSTPVQGHRHVYVGVIDAALLNNMGIK